MAFYIGLYRSFAIGALSIALSLNALPAMTKYFRIEPLPFTIVMVVLLAFLILRISENSKINSDSAIALVSTASFTMRERPCGGKS
ncbi:MAG: hypothetical protein LBT74_09015 [Acidobacteriota bacterium]|nr:hypothetical protein [Acidobacteriota bacterium]